MTKQTPRADIYTLTLNARAAAVAIYLTETWERMGKVVEDRVVTLEGVRVRQLVVTGKRPGEGEIAREMKNARDKRKAGAR